MGERTKIQGDPTPLVCVFKEDRTHHSVKAAKGAPGSRRGGQEALNVKCRRLFENLHVDRVTGT